MNKKIIICFSVIFAMIFCSCKREVSRFAEKKDDALREEFIFYFPDYLENKKIEQYSNVIQKRLEFISGDKVIMNKNIDSVSFLFSKDKMYEEEVFFVKMELLNNFQIRLYSVLNNKSDDMSGIELRPKNLNNYITDNKKLELITIPNVPFLVLKDEDISDVSVGSVRTSIGGNSNMSSFVIKILLKNKNSILSDKTRIMAKNGNEMIYVKIGNEYACSLYVLQVIEKEFSISVDGEFDALLMEMKYRYPFPK